MNEEARCDEQARSAAVLTFTPDLRARAAVELASLAHPEQAEVLVAALELGLLEPTHELMVWGHAQLYRAHVAELLGRLLRDDDLTQPTAAELLLCCSEASFRAPLNRDGFALFAALMREVFGDDPVLAQIPIGPSAPLTPMAADARERIARSLQRQIARSPVRGKAACAALRALRSPATTRRAEQAAQHAYAGTRGGFVRFLSTTLPGQRGAPVHAGRGASRCSRRSA